MANPGRTGVLTFHRCINYGSYWQARQLVEALQARGCDAVLLDHDDACVNRAEWRCALQPQLPARTPKADLPLYARKTRKFMKAIAQLPLSERFALDCPPEAGKFDLVIVGSDEVWNTRHPWYGHRALFFGEGLRTRRLVSYAASFGNHDRSQGLDPWWAERLQGFEAISVRDVNSAALIEQTIRRQAALVLDPCLQFPPAVAQDVESDPYVLVYGHSFPDWFKRGIGQWAGVRGLRLISVGYGNEWSHEQRIDAGPMEFARLMAAASAVATNFFHGCVFALLNGKPFASVTSQYRANKINDLARITGAEQHVMHEESTGSHFESVLGEPPDGSIEARIASLRESSGRFLDQVLR
jgi:polysaccharide pyruvyl transferase WcaK-like protein